MKIIAAILRKDLVTELRSKELFPTMLVFGILILLVFNFAFEFSAQIVPQTVSAILWITFIFSGLLSLSRSFSLEKENNALQGLIISPSDKSYIFIGKLLSNFVFIFLMEMILLAVFALFFNIGFLSILLPLILVIAVGSLGFITIGTFFSSMAFNTKLKELMLPVLTFPVIIPVIITSVKICTAILEGRGLEYYNTSLKVLITFDIMFVVVCTVLFEYLIEDI